MSDTTIDWPRHVELNDKKEFLMSWSCMHATLKQNNKLMESFGLCYSICLEFALIMRRLNISMRSNYYRLVWLPEARSHMSLLSLSVWHSLVSRTPPLHTSYHKHTHVCPSITHRNRLRGIDLYLETRNTTEHATMYSKI